MHLFEVNNRQSKQIEIKETSGGNFASNKKLLIVDTDKVFPIVLQNIPANLVQKSTKICVQIHLKKSGGGTANTGKFYDT